jgi:DNA-binding transcriptional ArsR family regulator
LRLVALAAEGEWRVADLVEILGHSKPRISRHLKLLTDAGVLARTREGTNICFRLAETQAARSAVRRWPACPRTIRCSPPTATARAPSVRRARRLCRVPGQP